MREAARAIVVGPDYEVLVVHETKNGRDRWMLPGGKIEPGERAWEAAVRELKEETGLVVDQAVPRKVAERRMFVDGDDWLIHYFLMPATIGTPTVTEPDKSDAVEYKSYQALFYEPKQIPELLGLVLKEVFSRGLV